MNEELTRLLEEIRIARNNDLNAPRRITDRTRIVSLIKKIQVVLLPGYYHFNNLSVEQALNELTEDLRGEISAALCFSGRSMMLTEQLTNDFLSRLPHIMRLLNTDIQAIYEGDPAAKSMAEVILCYPGFYAISIYRIAHELYSLGVPYIPRIMTEYAHEKTGIDINPGASIGEYFCIDHGTGIVIGETATIGHHVKLYQGVTIGAKSFEKDENGKFIRRERFLGTCTRSFYVGEAVKQEELKRNEVESQLSEDEKMLQNDNMWLARFNEQRVAIERG